ncbi:MAG: UDP-N-acetylmuramoyl-L-alanine--D-glutamate ligase [Propionibacteriaceae bacterium]|jgi:UDP-N-acetylmuramoylalanine--D-glutamate ligase|nr:UDP-N-acetylmuramoyl-L-alanine--D-glutamate ligase [Propionibacteriaceae bacterium]
MIDWLPTANRSSDWPQARVCIAGLGASGFSAADVLLHYGAQVRVIEGADSPSLQDKAHLLEILGAEVTLGAPEATLPDCDLVITSPGWRPNHPILAAATARGIPIWGDVELAWRFQQPDRIVPWLAVTGTNGKTTTVTMLESILRAAGLTTSAVGNVGRPILETVLDEVAYDVLAVELSSFQLHWAPSLSLHSAAVLNLEPDHLEWYETLAPTPAAAYAADKARIYHQVTNSCIYNVEDPTTEQMVVDADVVEGARAIGFTLGVPGPSMLGVVDDYLVDRAFIPQRRDSALELALIEDLPSSSPHMIANALAAAGLARSFGVSARAVREGLRNYELGPHRIETIASQAGVTWVDDSKATNAHAALAAIESFESVILIAGGLAKGTRFEQMVRQGRGRIKAALLIGADRGVVAEAFASEADEVPTFVFDCLEPQVMTAVVARAGELAQPGDTVLLAPACASQDIFVDYADRGDQFARAVRTFLTPQGGD